MHKLLSSVALTAFMAAPALGQEADTAGRSCELHLWAVRYVPPAQLKAQSNALVKVEPANYANPHSSASLLDARQRLAEIDAPSLLEHFGLSSDYRVVIHPDGVIAPKVFKDATSRMSESTSDCYIDFALFGRTHTAGKMSFSYDWIFRDFGDDNEADLYVKGSGSGNLIRRGEEDLGIQTKVATAQIIEQAGHKIKRRRERQR